MMNEYKTRQYSFPFKKENYVVLVLHMYCLWRRVMQKNLKKLIVGFIGISMVVVIVFSFYKGTDFLPKDSTWSEKGDENPKGENESGSKAKGDSAHKAVSMKSEVTTFGMTYKVNNITKTKKKGPLPKTNIYDFLKLDEEGTIQNNYSYLILNLSINNDLDEEQEITLNSYNILGKNDEGVYQEKLEPMLFDKRSDVENSEYFHFTLKPKEKMIFNLGYIAEDDTLQQYRDSMELIINNGGTFNYGDKDVRIIKIDL